MTPMAFHMFIFLITMSFSVYWEVFEIIADHAWGLTMQYSPWDTVRDLVCDVAGAGIVALYSRIYLITRDSDSFVEALKLHPAIKALIVWDTDKKAE